MEKPVFQLPKKSPQAIKEATQMRGFGLISRILQEMKHLSSASSSLMAGPSPHPGVGRGCTTHGMRKKAQREGRRTFKVCGKVRRA